MVRDVYATTRANASLHAIKRGKVTVEEDFLASEKDNQLGDILRFQNDRHNRIRSPLAVRLDFAFKNFQSLADERVVFEFIRRFVALARCLFFLWFGYQAFFEA